MGLVQLQWTVQQEPHQVLNTFMDKNCYKDNLKYIILHCYIFEP